MKNYLLMDGAVGQPLVEFADFDAASEYLLTLFRDHAGADVLDDLILMAVDDETQEIVAEGPELETLVRGTGSLAGTA